MTSGGGVPGRLPTFSPCRHLREFGRLPWAPSWAKSLWVSRASAARRLVP